MSSSTGGATDVEYSDRFFGGGGGGGLSTAFCGGIVAAYGEANDEGC